MGAFEIVLIVVAVVGILLGCTRYFRAREAVDRLGRSPQAMAHPEDHPIDERPSEDARDEPLPKRPLRARH